MLPLKLLLATAPAATISSFFLEEYDKFPSDKSTALMSWRSTLTTSPIMIVAVIIGYVSRIGFIALLIRM